MQFSEHFWNEDLCNFSGFEVLHQKLRKGRKLCKEYIEFLKLRGQAEEAHGKMLQKLSKLPFGKDEIGTLRQSLEVLRLHTESVGNEHIATANAIYEEAAKMTEFVLEQRKSMKLGEENVRKLQSKMKNAYKRTTDAKKAYYSKCREAENQQDVAAGAAEKSGYIVKELEKKVVRCQQTAEHADALYASAIEMLNETRDQWEGATEETCQIFQSLEEQRIQTLRNSLWLVMNLSSRHCVNEDLMNENLRTILEKVDHNYDLEVFVRQMQTGSVRPAPCDYEPYQACHDCGSSISDASISTLQKSELSMTLHNTGEKLKKFFSFDSSSSNKKDVRINAVNFTENDLYESVESLDSFTDVSDFYSVQYDYTSRREDELTLKQGDIVKVLSKGSDDWWEVETQDNKKGVFPANYLILHESHQET